MKDYTSKFTRTAGMSPEEIRKREEEEARQRLINDLPAGAPVADTPKSFADRMSVYQAEPAAAPTEDTTTTSEEASEAPSKSFAERMAPYQTTTGVETDVEPAAETGGPKSFAERMAVYQEPAEKPSLIKRAWSYVWGVSEGGEDSPKNTADPVMTQTLEEMGLTPGEYSQTDMAGNAQAVATMRTFLKVRYNMTGVDEMSAEEVTETFLDGRRSFVANTARTTQELVWVKQNQDDEESMKAIQGAYALFDNMENAVLGDTSIGEKAEAIWDYTSSAALDPLNYLAFIPGVGQVGRGAVLGAQKATSVSIKAIISSKVAGLTAKSGAKRVALKEGLTAGGNRELEQRLIQRSLREAALNTTIKETAVRKASEQVLLQSKGFRRFVDEGVRGAAWRQTSRAALIEGTVAVGQTWAEQLSYVESGYSEEMDKWAFGMAAIAGSILGGAGGAAQVVSAKGSTLFGKVEIDKAGLEQALTSTLNEVKAYKVTRIKQASDAGLDIDNLDLDKMALSDLIFGVQDSSGTQIKGLAEQLIQRGYNYKAGDDIGDATLSVFDNVSSETLKELLDVLGVTGREGPAWEQLSTILNGERELLDLMGEIAGTKGKDMKDVTYLDLLKEASGQQREAAGLTQEFAEQAGKDFGGGPDSAYFQDFNRGALGTSVDLTSNLPGGGSRVFSALHEVNKGLGNVYISALVSSWATSFRNVVGAASVGTFNTAAEVVEGLLLTAGGTLSRNAAMRSKGFSILRAGLSRPMFVFNQTTQANFMDEIMGMYVEDMAGLSKTLAGGVSGVASESGASSSLSLGTRILGTKAASMVEVGQRLAGVQLVDNFMKSQAFNHHLNKEVRQTLGKTLNEISASTAEEQKSILKGTKFGDAVKRAVAATEAEVFSLDNKDIGLGFLQGIKEVGVLGAMVMPFGKFIGNVARFTANTTGVPQMFAASGGKAAAKWSKGYDPTFAAGLSRLVVSSAAVYTFKEMADENRKKGLGMFETELEDGTIYSTELEFPIPLFQGLGYILSKHQDGTLSKADVELFKDKAMGLDVTQSTERMWRELTSEGLSSLVSFILSQYVQGVSRPAATANTLVGVAKGDIATKDRSAGRGSTFNNAFRYTENIFGSMLGDRTDDVKIAEGGKIVSDVGKVVGPSGYVKSNTARILTMLGREPYSIETAASKTEMAPGLINIQNEELGADIEVLSTKLMANQAFQQADLETKKIIWGRELAQMKRMYYLDKNLQWGDEYRGGKIVKLATGRTPNELKEAMSTLGLNGPMEELPLEDVILLEGYFEARKSRLYRSNLAARSGLY